MFRSPLSCVVICFVLIFSDSVSGAQINSTDMPQSQGLPTRQRDARSPVANETVATASQEINAKLNALLSNINQGKDPSLEDLTQIAATLKKNSQSLQRADAKGQSDLQLLNAWMNYFGGEIKRAKLAANAAFRADAKNKDAGITLVVMAIADNDIAKAKTTITAMRKNVAKPAASTRTERPGASSGAAAAESPAVLDFDVNSVNVELLDKNIGAFDAACLNGTSLSFKGGKTLMMLLWANPGGGEATTSGDETARPMMPSMASRQGQKDSSAETYGSLFAKDFENDKIAFLGLNLDAASDGNAVMASLMKNAWPWPQAMAQDPRNTSLASFVSLKADKPLLVILGPDGAIKYAGAFSDLMLRVMAHQAQSSPELAKPETAKKLDQPNAPPISANVPKEANAPGVITEQPKPSPKPKSQKRDYENLNPAAADLYQFAVSQKGMAHIVGYGKMIDACRQILKEYPDAPEAEKARQLLREVPENKRQQFHITNEEMGL